MQFASDIGIVYSLGVYPSSPMLANIFVISLPNDLDVIGLLVKLQWKMIICPWFCEPCIRITRTMRVFRYFPDK